MTVFISKLSRSAYADDESQRNKMGSDLDSSRTMISTGEDRSNVVLREWKQEGVDEGKMNEDKKVVQDLSVSRTRRREWMSPWKKRGKRRDEDNLEEQKDEQEGDDQGNDNGEQRQSQEHDRLRQEILDEVMTCGKMQRRPDKISIVVHRFSTDERYGYTLYSDSDERLIRIQSVDEDSSGLLNLPAALRVNDILESVNNINCHDKNLSEIAAQMREFTGKVTFTFSTIPLSQPPLIFQSIAIRPQQNNAPENKDDEGEDHNADALENAITSFSNHGIVFGKKTPQDYLSVQKFQSDGWLVGNRNCVEKGSLVLLIDQSVSLVDLDANDAQTVLESYTQCRPFTSITTLAPTLAQRRWERIRKTSKAVGGGTMVGVGAAIMVTPLHPLGHAMAIGGASLIGSEFNGAKKVMDKAKERLTAPKKVDLKQKDSDKNNGNSE